MIELTVAQIAEIVGGAVADISPQDAAHRRVTGTVEFDSRAIGPGGLFLALPGARADGHDHAASAVAAGAAVALQLLEREVWIKQARTDAERLRDEDVSTEPDAW